MAAGARLLGGQLPAAYRGSRFVRQIERVDRFVRTDVDRVLSSTAFCCAS
jgi:hypothetical protein